MSTITLSREQLYERVWSSPMTRVATELSVSDVALKKTCKRLNVPTPERGYWARLAAGVKVTKTPLPKQADVAEVRVDVDANKRRREEIEEERAAVPPEGPPRLALPANSSNLHSTISDLYKVLRSSKPDSRGLIQIRNSKLPAVEVSPSVTERVARALSALYSELEARGVVLKPSSRGQEIGFWKGKDEIILFAEEPIDTIEREPTAEEKRRPSWEWKTKSSQPSGRLNFSLYSPNGRSGGRSKWKEGPRKELEIVLHEIAERVWGFFSDEEEWRRRDAERQKQMEEDTRVRAEQERKAAHERKVDDAGAQRITNLIRASEWWRLRQNAHDFIASCERQWRETAGNLTKEQGAWLSWARRQADALSPLNLGYPQPDADGGIDPSTIPFGGPYPQTKLLPLPPTLEKPAPAEPSYSTGWHAPQPQPYPFWLRHPRR